jgi:hypothetical protein
VDSLEVENKDNGRSCSVQKLAVQVSIMAFGGGPIEESNGKDEVYRRTTRGTTMAIEHVLQWRAPSEPHIRRSQLCLDCGRTACVVMGYF